MLWYKHLLTVALQNCLYGFNAEVDCHRWQWYHLVYPDAMHNTSSGLFKHLIEVTEQALQENGQHDDVREHSQQLPSFMELHLPAKRQCANITAAQRHSLGACMPVCLLGLVGMEPYRDAFTGARLPCISCLCTTKPGAQQAAWCNTATACAACNQRGVPPTGDRWPVQFAPGHGGALPTLSLLV